MGLFTSRFNTGSISNFGRGTFQEEKDHSLSLVTEPAKVNAYISVASLLGQQGSSWAQGSAHVDPTAKSKRKLEEKNKRK